MKRLAGVFLLLFLAAAAAQAYVVKLKDGSLVFARIKYEVRGAKAIITLENGTVTQIDLDKVDVPGTEEYNKKFSGNVIAIDTPDQKILNQREAVPTPATRLQDLAKPGKLRPSIFGSLSAPAAGSSGPGSWQPADPLVQAAFSKALDGAAIPQWRLTNYRGKNRLLVTTNSEEAVFTVLSAAARAVNDLSERGRDTVVEIVLTTSTNEAAGAFDMGPEQAKQLVNGTVAVGDYFVRNVNL
jgi:hypothetical protein